MEQVRRNELIEDVILTGVAEEWVVLVCHSAHRADVCGSAGSAGRQAKIPKRYSDDIPHVSYSPYA